MSGIHQEVLHIKNLLSVRQQHLAKLRKRESLTRAETMDFEICSQQVAELTATLNTLLKLEQEKANAQQKTLHNRL